jgi:DNA-directed RNA polymerase subunit RPC12/RpoP
MSNFMKLEVTQKGATYCADCAKCGQTMYSHEWASWSNNDDRDSLQDGTAQCPDCGGRADPDTFTDCGRMYAARYSAPGYLDCTDWTYGKNKRELMRDMRDLYMGD